MPKGTALDKQGRLKDRPAMTDTTLLLSITIVVFFLLYLFAVFALGGSFAKEGVVAALGAVGAEVLAGDSLGGQIGLEVLLELVAAVVRRNGDHKQFLL